jgi:hypothetical protein
MHEHNSHTWCMQLMQEFTTQFHYSSCDMIPKSQKYAFIKALWWYPLHYAMAC